MADVADLDSVPPVELLLEREDHDHLADVLPDLLYPSGAPRPDLRADEIKNRNAQPIEIARQPQVEVREVDEHGGVGLAPRGFRHQMLEAPSDIGKMFYHLHQSNHRNFIGVDQQLASGSAHLLAAHAEEACAGR